MEDANELLRGFSKKAAVQSGPTLDQLQGQLDELKKRGLRTLRLTRLQADEVPRYGLIDSGATNPLRPLLPDDDLSQVERAWVSLADGQRTPMLVNKKGVMLSTNLNIEPIIPMGWLTAAGCEIMWTEGKIILKHPIRGKIEIKVELGCPQVDRNLAMELIRELETGKLAKRAKAVDLVPEEVRPSEEDEGLVRWMEMLVQDHPVLSGLPLHIRECLVVQPGELKHLPANRHKRRRMKDGYLLHMYAGSADGFCLAKAFREVGLSSKILEVDVQRGSDQDLLKGPLYPALIRSALQGQILGVLGGPNCRTRSVLRHYPRPGYPRPVRSWASSQEFGLDDLTESERLMVQEDDILLWRQVFLYVVSDLVLKATKPGGGGGSPLD